MWKNKDAFFGGRYSTGAQPYEQVGPVRAIDGGSRDGRSIDGVGHPAVHLAPAQVARRRCVGCYCQSQADGGTVRPRWAASNILWLSLIHISEPTRLGMNSYAVFCLKK